MYAKVDRRINADARFRELTHEAQLLYLRLLTGAHTTLVPGLWAANLEGLAAAWRFQVEPFRERFGELSVKGLADADWDAGAVWLPDAIVHADPANLNMVRGWAPHLAVVPDCLLKLEAIGTLSAWLSVEKPWFAPWSLSPVGTVCPRPANAHQNGIGNGMANGIGNGMANGMPTQDQDQKQDQKQSRKLHSQEGLDRMALDAVGEANRMKRAGGARKR